MLVVRCQSKNIEANRLTQKSSVWIATAWPIFLQIR
jgi:hypothetical protein